MGALPGQVTRSAVLLGVAMGLLLVGLEVAEARLDLRGTTALVSLVPVAVAVVAGGPLAGGLAAAVALAGVAALLGGTNAIVVALRQVAPGLVLGAVLVRRLHLPVALAVVAVASLVGILGLVRVFVPGGSQFFTLLGRQVEAQVADLDRLSSRLGLGDEAGLARESARVVAAAMRVVGPGLVTVGLLVVALVNCVVARLCLRGRGFRAFAEETVPDHLVWGVIAAGVMLVSQHEGIARVGVNLLVVLAPLYAIQGLAVLRHFFQRARVPRPLQGVGFGLFALQPLLLVAAACLGLSDLWVDFRKIRRAATPA
jgi:uncharacterized protein YybS (DUF2232 family)